MVPKVNGGYSALDERPAHLVRRYGELYSQLRLETLDSLDKLPPLVNSDELKIKLLFSVVVVSFLLFDFFVEFIRCFHQFFSRILKIWNSRIAKASYEFVIHLKSHDIVHFSLHVESKSGLCLVCGI